MVTERGTREPHVPPATDAMGEGWCVRRSFLVGLREPGRRGYPSKELPFLTEVHHVRDDPLH